MKKVKARVLDENNDLVWKVIEVPVEDKRTEYKGAPVDGVADHGNVGVGNPMANSPEN